MCFRRHAVIASPFRAQGRGTTCSNRRSATISSAYGRVLGTSILLMLATGAVDAVDKAIAAAEARNR